MQPSTGLIPKITINSKYKPLGTFKSRYLYLYGGRGSGKSFAVSLYLAQLTYQKGHKILFTRYTLATANKSIIPEFQEKLKIGGIESHFNITKTSIVNKKTGSEIIFAGIKTSSGNQTASLKSLQGITTWVYEEFEEHPDEQSFDSIDLSIRSKDKQNRIILVSNALHKESWQYKRFFENEDDIEFIYTNYKDNIRNLNENFLQKAEREKELNLAKYNKNFLGLHYEDDENSLWKWDHIVKRNIDPSKLDRIVVAVDPAVTSGKNSDETGIIVCGKVGNEGYVLEDRSGIYTPNEWSQLIITLYNKWKADRVIGEVNQGGDMIEAILRTTNKTVSYKGVRASRGKTTRAEPILSLYEQGMIYHAGNFPDLELQMTTWNPNKGRSPDRIDALVWGFTELLLQKTSGWVI